MSSPWPSKWSRRRSPRLRFPSRLNESPTTSTTGRPVNCLEYPSSLPMGLRVDQPDAKARFEQAAGRDDDVEHEPERAHLTLIGQRRQARQRVRRTRADRGNLSNLMARILSLLAVLVACAAATPATAQAVNQDHGLQPRRRRGRSAALRPAVPGLSRGERRWRAGHRPAARPIPALVVRRGPGARHHDGSRAPACPASSCSPPSSPASSPSSAPASTRRRRRCASATPTRGQALFEGKARLRDLSPRERATARASRPT